MVTTLFGNNLRRVIFLLMVGVFVSIGIALAAPPDNDECASAFVVTPGVAISGQTLNIEATFDSDDPELSCTMGPGFGSVFFEFVATYTSARVRADVDSVGLDSDFAVYAVDQTDDCDKSLWTEIGCSEDGEFEFNGDICIEGLTVNHTYKIMLVSFTEGSSSEYTLQIDSPCPGQAIGDDDSDGIDNLTDNCPATANTDQADTDNDGIGDACDSCPNEGDERYGVDASGCPNDPTDTDGDGVFDNDDACPATPAGETVDANGCSGTQLDDDGDGVSNALDLCPATPAGETVDTNGCSGTQRDDDGDGFSEYEGDCNDANSTVYPGATPVVTAELVPIKVKKKKGCFRVDITVGEVCGAEPTVDALLNGFSVINGQLVELKHKKKYRVKTDDDDSSDDCGSVSFEGPEFVLEVIATDELGISGTASAVYDFDDRSSDDDGSSGRGHKKKKRHGSDDDSGSGHKKK